MILTIPKRKSPRACLIVVSVREAYSSEVQFSDMLVLEEAVLTLDVSTTHLNLHTNRESERLTIFLTLTCNVSVKKGKWQGAYKWQYGMTYICSLMNECV